MELEEGFAKGAGHYFCFDTLFFSFKLFSHLHETGAVPAELPSYYHNCMRDCLLAAFEVYQETHYVA